MNPGNKGQRYTMATLTGVRAESDKVIKTLSCGHEILAAWGVPEDANRVAENTLRQIGTRQRCNQCESKPQAQQGKPFVLTSYRQLNADKQSLTFEDLLQGQSKENEG